MNQSQSCQNVRFAEAHSDGGNEILTSCPYGQTCLERIRGFEKALTDRLWDDELAVRAGRILRQAKRFFHSNEFGACSYELDCLDGFIH